MNDLSGEFFVVLQLGTPPKEIVVILDTGSELFWVQCQPCTKCGVQTRDPIFDPKSSTSFQAFGCAADLATSCPADDAVAEGCDAATGSCTYQVSYGDNSSSSGVVAYETLTFNTNNGGSFQLQQTLFGCGIDNEGDAAQLNVSGILGCDLGEYSIPLQMNAQNFSYCFPNRIQNVDSTGFIVFNSTVTSQEMQYTSFIQSNASNFVSSYYNINLTGVSVNDKLLDIPSSALQLDDAGDGGCFIDSGTTYTTFVDGAFSVVKDAFQKAMSASAKEVNLGSASFELCWEFPTSQQPQAPSVTLHFEGHMDVALQSYHLLLPAGSSESFDYYCMAFLNAGSQAAGRNVYGNFQQQDFLVQYDLANFRLGVAPYQCSPNTSTPGGSGTPSGAVSGILFNWAVHFGFLFALPLSFL